LQAAAVSSGRSSPPASEVVTFIDAHRDSTTDGRRWGVEPICEQLTVAPALTTTAGPAHSKRNGPRRELPTVRSNLEEELLLYGKRKLTKAGRRRGHDCGREQGARLMKRQASAGLEAKKRFTTQRGREPPSRTGPRQRAFVASRPDQLWSGLHLLLDVEWGGLCRLHHRRVLAATGGWKASRSMTATSSSTHSTWRPDEGYETRRTHLSHGRRSSYTL